MTHKDNTIPTIDEYKGKILNPSYGTDEDRQAMFHIAGSILRHVSMFPKPNHMDNGV
jgi:hypothetical protein